MATAAFATCVSCASEPRGGGEGSFEEGYFSISMAIDNGRPSSRGNIVETPGTASENNVSELYVILFGKTDNIAKYVFNFTIRTTDDGTGFEEYHLDDLNWPPTPVPGIEEGSDKFLYSYDGNKSFVTWARKIAREEYNMMVIVNPPGENAGGGSYGDYITLIQKGAALDDLLAPLQIEPFTMGYFGVFPRQGYYYGITPENSFFMSNHQGLVPISLDDIKESVSEANNAPVSVKVSRGAAKISLNTMYPTVFTNGTVVFLDWELDVMNRFMYPLRKLTNLLGDGGGKGALETNGDGSLRKNQYAEDPNFTGYGYISGATDAQREAQFAYSYKKSLVPVTVVYDKYYTRDEALTLPAYDSATEANLTPTLQYTYDRSVQADPVYCLENTFDVTDQFPEVMTAVLVRAKYIPAGFTEDDSYFVFNSRYISVAQMAGYADDPSSINPASGLDGLETAMIAAGLTSSSAVNGLSASFDTKGLSYFHLGINYYRIPIRHHTDESLNPANGDYYGYYGIVRNNHYNIAIGRVVGPGKPTVKPDPEVSVHPIIKLMAWDEKILDYDL